MFHNCYSLKNFINFIVLYFLQLVFFHKYKVNTIGALYEL